MSGVLSRSNQVYLSWVFVLISRKPVWLSSPSLSLRPTFVCSCCGWCEIQLLAEGGEAFACHGEHYLGRDAVDGDVDLRQDFAGKLEDGCLLFLVC